MTTLTAKSSTIYIAAGNGTQVFRSLAQVPPRLRQKLHETTQGRNSATILIADRQGREELVRALQGEPSRVQCRLAESLRMRQSQAGAPAKARPHLSLLRRWLELLLPLAIGASLWLLVEMRF